MLKRYCDNDCEAVLGLTTERKGHDREQKQPKGQQKGKEGLQDGEAEIRSRW